MRLIDADSLKEVMCTDCDNRHLCTESPACGTVQQVDAMPTIEPKHGRWIKLFETENDITARCSECGMVYTLGKGRDPNFCGNCGCKMDEVEE